jgi:hypothetical protein
MNAGFGAEFLESRENEGRSTETAALAGSSIAVIPCVRSASRSSDFDICGLAASDVVSTTIAEPRKNDALVRNASNTEVTVHAGLSRSVGSRKLFATMFIHVLL